MYACHLNPHNTKLLFSKRKYSKKILGPCHDTQLRENRKKRQTQTVTPNINSKKVLTPVGQPSTVRAPVRSSIRLGCRTKRPGAPLGDTRKMIGLKGCSENMERTPARFGDGQREMTENEFDSRIGTVAKIIHITNTGVSRSALIITHVYFIFLENWFTETLRGCFFLREIQRPRVYRFVLLHLNRSRSSRGADGRRSFVRFFLFSDHDQGTRKAVSKHYRY